MQSVNNLLNYCGMLYSNREPIVIQLYLEALVGKKLSPESRRLMLKSLPKLVSDALYRKSPLPGIECLCSLLKSHRSAYYSL